MIVVVSSAPKERAAFVALCESKGWPVIGCASVGRIARVVARNPPRVVVTRHQLEDGYSDDIIAALASSQLLPQTKLIVLLAAGTPASAETRQLDLGADCVLRDPLRAEVLLAYLAKYLKAPRHRSATTPAPSSAKLSFAGTVLDVSERTLRYRGKMALLTPREMGLAEVLARSRGQVVTYEMLYDELLSRKFAGETSNMRVLLGKLATSAQKIGVPLREWIEVIPKSGYRYRPPSPPGDESAPA